MVDSHHPTSRKRGAEFLYPRSSAEAPLENSASPDGGLDYPSSPPGKISRMSDAGNEGLEFICNLIEEGISLYMTDTLDSSHSRKLFKCNKCDYVSKKRSNAKRHARSCSGGPHRYQCPLCVTESFPTSHALASHVQAMHPKNAITEETIFDVNDVCRFCRRTSSGSTVDLDRKASESSAVSSASASGAPSDASNFGLPLMAVHRPISVSRGSLHGVVGPRSQPAAGAVSGSLHSKPGAGGESRDPSTARLHSLLQAAELATCEYESGPGVGGTNGSHPSLGGSNLRSPGARGPGPGPNKGSQVPPMPYSPGTPGGLGPAFSATFGTSPVMSGGNVFGVSPGTMPLFASPAVPPPPSARLSAPIKPEHHASLHRPHHTSPRPASPPNRNLTAASPSPSHGGPVAGLPPHLVPSPLRTHMPSRGVPLSPMYSPHAMRPGPPTANQAPDAGGSDPRVPRHHSSIASTRHSDPPSPEGNNDHDGSRVPPPSGSTFPPIMWGGSNLAGVPLDMEERSSLYKMRLRHILN
eukprot:Rmarinus@m.9605